MKAGSIEMQMPSCLYQEASVTMLLSMPLRTAYFSHTNNEIGANYDHPSCAKTCTHAHTQAHVMHTQDQRCSLGC